MAGLPQLTLQRQMPVDYSNVAPMQLPWQQAWQKYLAEQAAWQQQTSQQLHNLGPYANNPLASGQPLLSSQQMMQMRAMMGQDTGSITPPNLSAGGGMGSLAQANEVAQYLAGLGIG